jgi:hypothetical protein
VAERDFPGRRWFSIALRTLHLTGVVLTGAGLFGNDSQSAAGVALMLVTGVALYALDLWHHPDLWREVAGLFVALKLAVLIAMLLVPAAAMTLFWVLLVSSSVVSHASYAFRHTRVVR